MIHTVMHIRPGSIDIVGSLDPLQVMSITSIAVAARTPQPLKRDSAFTGRTTTRLYADAHAVVKLRTELNFGTRDSRIWAEQAVARERALAVHPPAKTWFVAEAPEGPIIGNVAPRLMPLHAEGGLGDEARRFAALEPLLKQYFSLAARHDRRLDEGLSNFGLDAQERLYYLDDDLYPWDDHTGFAAGLGSWLRAEPAWCAEARIEQLGRWLRTAVLSAWGERHQLHVLGGQLRQVFMPAGPGREAMARLQDLLLARKDARVVIPVAASPALPPVVAADAARFALLADVHANRPALQAVLRDIDARGIASGLVLGDVVGYGPHPRECIAMLRERGYTVIQGNHDYGAATGSTRRGFSTLAREVVEWTRTRLDDDERAWLGALPPHLRGHDWLAVHGAPIDKHFFYAYVYHMTYTLNLDWLEREGVRLAFHGHTHLAGVYARRDGEDLHATGAHFDLANADQALICPGSVGQTRSGTPGAEYAVVDREAGTVDFVRLDYDLEATACDLRAAGLSVDLASRLRAGR
ncbi:hypothetical protein Thpro_022561 [Acidihalobacter prosperus]|uniref:Calcineurin-like phosphoesterase domain-containing protein n=2 Tax=Acidihalobacter prosperus TaxID=160660 RepID=A0A1A6C166_9GAMM|nr:hypothetical protein Thpro_022561 [Acidihalobacter prosperus]